LGDGPHEFGIVGKLIDLFEIFDTIAEIIVDIPIGLFDAGTAPRFCDINARKKLSPRGSTVFPAPLRPCLTAGDYHEACTISKRLSGKSLSKQAYNIFSKIHEVDTLLRSNAELRSIVKEAHPELGFCFLNGGQPVLSKKKHSDGLDQRLELLKNKIPSAINVYKQALSKFSRKHLAKDDVVDALMCLAISIAPAVDRHIMPVRPDADSYGIEMCMHYVLLD
jgi:predicted RNase H-like nuclease